MAYSPLGGRLLIPTETNMVSLDLSSLNIRAPEMIKRGREMFPENPLTVGATRFVVHHQIEERAIDDVLRLLRTFRNDMKHNNHEKQDSPVSDVKEHQLQERLLRPFPSLGY